MREIKFRAWNDAKKEFIYSDNLRCFVQEKHHKFDAGGAHDDYVDFPDYDFDVEQYTGLKDVNGKEIYEGDILLSHKIAFLVVWDSPRAYFLMWRNEARAHRFSIDAIDFHKIMVIGNIHENPELLDG